MAATIIDIAELAGTSKSTVSRYLTGGTVKKKTAASIEAAIESLQYTPNINARRLVQSKTNVIGVVFDDISMYFYAEIMQGIQDVANQNQYVCNFFSRANCNRRESDFLSLFAQGQVDGIVFATFRQRDAQEIAEIAAAGLPVVLLGSRADHSGISHVDVDNRLGISELVGYLSSLGHRRIAYLNGPEAMPAALSRLDGYIQGIRNCDLPFEKSLVVDIPWSVEGGRSAVHELAARRETYTALIGSNEFCAFGAARAMQAAGLRVPDDVSVAGFDDSPLLQYASPCITTLRQPFLQMGQMAVKQLMARLLDPQATPASIYLQPKLMVRDSCMKVLSMQETDGSVREGGAAC
jgi:DNA-binding LacI/PurR family transcriptional regulator